jgi:hypothetical protein
MSKEVTLQLLDPVGVVEGEIKMKTSTINQIGRNRLVILDSGKPIGHIKVIDDDKGNIIDIELDKY